MTSRSEQRKKPQWGNAAWKAVMKQHEWRKGRPGLRMCSRPKRDGSPCGKLAMRGTTVCLTHGGRMVAANRKRWEAIRAQAANQGRQLGSRFKKAGNTGGGAQTS
jgi:hypothetical protein